MQSIWLDDLRESPSSNWMICRSVNSAIKYFLASKSILIVSLDHDLGDYASDGGDAYKFLDWMIENDRWPTKSIKIHSANPVGRANMQRTIERYAPFSNFTVVRGQSTYF